jgi:NADH:ubiquinone oxidoreductase subunit 5 (subunit L)/multisubunit Na+/H+ antiporter MnhA subunit
MSTIIHSFILLPFLSFLVLLIIPKNREKTIGNVALISLGIQLVLSLGFVAYWVIQGAHPVNLRDITLLEEPNFEFYIDFFFDTVTAVFLLTGVLLTFVVVGYSRIYMHKEEGFKRFYSTILFFWLGYVFTIWSGNFGTLFIGWEFLGLSSFLLIAFYRTRYLPVKNAVKVFSVYRIGDIGILMTIWAGHHLLHQNVLFAQFHSEVIKHILMEHFGATMFISMMILITALAKSAQWPFSSWLPRAMEGPTPSSAIFYGSLSVHLGAFLLLRTHPIWEHHLWVRGIIIAFGLITFIVGNYTARVQSTIKGKIAYSSSAQIGLIFMEIALGLDYLALIHYMGNAFLRSYQLLISPSVATYQIREQFYTYKEPLKTSISKWSATLNMLSLKEWNMEKMQFYLLFNPLKKLGKFTLKLTLKSFLIIIATLYFFALALSQNWFDIDISSWNHGAAVAMAILALFLVARAYADKSSAIASWLLLVAVHFVLDLSIALNQHLNWVENSVYLSGIIISGLIGFVILFILQQKLATTLSLKKYWGLVNYNRFMAFTFLLAALGLAGFPITSTFLGEDLLLSHIEDEQWLLAALVAFTFIFNGIVIIRIYARLFLGSQVKTYNQSNHVTTL